MTQTAIDSRAELIGVAQRRFGAATVLAAEPHPFASSCPLTRLTLRSRAGATRSLLVKDLGAARRHRAPAALHDPRREPAVYAALRGPDTGSPRCLGTHVDPARGHHWLFLEPVDGIPLWQSADERAWIAAAAALARLHRAGPRLPEGLAIRYDAEFFARWLPRAERLAPAAELHRLAEVHAWAGDRLAGAPAGFVHGDFYPANLLVTDGPGLRVRVVDFELAGIGPAALDLAALVTGLPAERADALLGEYWEHSLVPMPRDELAELVQCARLHLAVRWLGWLEEWHAPDHQAFDWAAEAHTAAAALSGADG